MLTGSCLCGAVRFEVRDPGISPRFRQWTSSAAPWDPAPDDGLQRYSAGRPD